jgi:hypothetical protein
MVKGFKEFVNEAIPPDAYSKGGKVAGFKPPKVTNFTYGDTHVTIEHEGKQYFHTGKTGKHIATGEPSWEYSNESGGADRRIWVRQSGKVDRD